MQTSLFEHTPGLKTIRFKPEFRHWRTVARRCLLERLAPDSIWWLEDPNALDVDDPAGKGRSNKQLATLLRATACHRHDDRWALMYRLVWRVTHGEPHLLQLSGDADVAKATRYTQAVHRDIHKMKAFVRFSRMEDSQPERYLTWFEPDHHVVPAVADFFRRRYTNMRWSVLTPDQCAHWEGSGHVRLTAGLDRENIPNADQFEKAWQLYYRSIFNPARLKVSAMQSEMPQKYWRHLPEAELLPELVIHADERTSNMLRRVKASDELQCGPTPDDPTTQHLKQPRATPFAQLKAAADFCRGCPLWRDATQTVFGEGSLNASLMLVGEQPGDHEDLSGKPFQGPAGTVLDQALHAAGIPRSDVYLTNAVKHFKHRVVKKVRIHDKPAATEIQACRQWLTAELNLVQPRVIVCLGKSAALAVTGQDLAVAHHRGTVLAVNQHSVLLTYHPAHALRTGYGRQRIEAAISQDLQQAYELSQQPSPG